MRVLVLGDSLGLPRPYKMQNYSPTEKELAVSYDQTYPSILQKELLEKFRSEPYFEVVNRSKRFCTLKDIASEFTDYLFFYEPDIIVLQIGIVDCWFRESKMQIVNSEEFKGYLNKIMLMLSLRPNCYLIIVGISPTSIKMDERYPGLNKEIKKYNNIYKDCVDNKRFFYIDMEKYVEPANVYKYLLLDDHHLNPQGNRLVAEKILKIIHSLVYNQMGYNLHKEQNLLDALEKFQLAYTSYSYNIDSIYNYILMLVEHKKTVQLKEVATFCKENIVDSEINELLTVLNL